MLRRQCRHSCAVLKNFRSKYVGETEGNLEHTLGVLRSLGPVVVIIDEADAALGNRESDGDSGTSARVFSMIARQMGDTRYRGKIVWMLLTSRPDLLPIDLKRQGRAEVHIPLFYPHDQTEFDAMFVAMAKKCKVKLAAGLPGPIDVNLGLSGADIESVVLASPYRSRTSCQSRPFGSRHDYTRRSSCRSTTLCLRHKDLKKKCKRFRRFLNVPRSVSCPNDGSRKCLNSRDGPDCRSDSLQFERFLEQASEKYFQNR